MRAGSAPEVGQGDRCITLVRVDPARFRARLLTPAQGGPLPAPGWSEAARLYEGLVLRAPSYEAYVRLGEIHVQGRLRARDADEGEAHARRAREVLRKALEVRPQDPLVQRLLADLERGAP